MSGKHYFTKENRNDIGVPCIRYRAIQESVYGKRTISRCKSAIQRCIAMPVCGHDEQDAGGAVQTTQDGI